MAGLGSSRIASRTTTSLIFSDLDIRNSADATEEALRVKDAEDLYKKETEESHRIA